jgi:hypothetical protein
MKKIKLFPVPRTTVNRLESSLNKRLRIIYANIINKAIKELKPYSVQEREAYIPIATDNRGREYKNDIYAAISDSKSKIMDATAASISRQLKRPIDYRYYNREVKEKILYRTFLITTTQITDNISDGLKDVLINGMAQGASANQIISHLDMLEGNHKTIARTEINTAANEASFDLAARELTDIGLIGAARKGWQSADDEKVRETHLQAQEDYGDGNEIPLEETFTVGEAQIMYPSEYGNNPEETINCRCSYYITYGGL